MVIKISFQKFWFYFRHGLSVLFKFDPNFFLWNNFAVKLTSSEFSISRFPMDKISFKIEMFSCFQQLLLRYLKKKKV